MNIAQIFWNSRPSFASKPILVVDDKDVSFDELADRVQRLTGVLRSRGIGTGDHVVLALQHDIPEDGTAEGLADLLKEVATHGKDFWTPAVISA